jgi:hypothetical protein
MKKLVLLTMAVAVLAGAWSGADEGTTYGKGVTLDKAVAIPELLSRPDEYVGKKVRVEGVVSAVCAKRGCWMMVTDPDSGKGVRIKVEDGVIVFPMEAMGHKAAAEGVFEVVGPGGEHAGAGMKGEHAGAQQHGEHAPAAGAAAHSCAEQEKAAAKAAASYQISGIGAVVY